MGETVSYRTLLYSHEIVIVVNIVYGILAAATVLKSNPNAQSGGLNAPIALYYSFACFTLIFLFMHVGAIAALAYRKEYQVE